MLLLYNFTFVRRLNSQYLMSSYQFSPITICYVENVTAVSKQIIII